MIILLSAVWLANMISAISISTKQWENIEYIFYSGWYFEKKHEMKPIHTGISENQPDTENHDILTS